MHLPSWAQTGSGKMLETAPSTNSNSNGNKRPEIYLDSQLNQKRQVKLKTCADVYDYWRTCKRLYKKAPKDGVEFQIDYIDTGLLMADEETRLKAPIALALHGAPGSYHDFTLLIHHLSQQNVRVIAPNFPEYIATVRTKVLFRHSADEKAAYLRDFLKAINVNKIDLLVSHSSAIFPTLLILLNANKNQNIPTADKQDGRNRAKTNQKSITHEKDAADGDCGQDSDNIFALAGPECRLFRDQDGSIAPVALADQQQEPQSIGTCSVNDIESGQDSGDEIAQSQLSRYEAAGSSKSSASSGSTKSTLTALDKEILEHEDDECDHEIDGNNNDTHDERKYMSELTVKPRLDRCHSQLLQESDKQKQEREETLDEQLEQKQTKRHLKAIGNKSKGQVNGNKGKRSEDVIVQFDQPIEIKAVALFNPAGHRLPKSMKPTWFKCGSCRIYQHKLGRSLFRKLGPAFLTIIGVPVRVDNMDNVMLSATVMRNSKCHRVVKQLEQLSEIKLPTLLVFSENDKLIEKEIFYEMTQHMSLDKKNFDVFNNEGDLELSRKYSRLPLNKLTFLNTRLDQLISHLVLATVESRTEDWIRVMVFKAGGHYAYSNYAKTVNKAVSELLKKVT